MGIYFSYSAHGNVVSTMSWNAIPNECTCANPLAAGKKVRAVCTAVVVTLSGKCRQTGNRAGKM